ncbi:MAG TPA: GMC family oxidoreductase N-terminal domain-containing protein [Jatrophihabitans sp.]|nr:GMC family oxidoreductase N-terminal domain-containing protein [Jatrophihabitans sp.]
MASERTADYVIVGAGSAGCVLADRLSADGTATVLLVEAGGPDRKAEISIPAAYPKLFGTAFDWGFETVAQPGLAGRRVGWPRGRTLGGSSSLNAQIWTRCHRADYDGWELDGWRFADVLPYFLRAERRLAGEAELGYGEAGPVHVSDLLDPSPATAAFLRACAEAGLPGLGPSEATEPDGYGPVRVTQRNGRRWSAADAYLRPALGRPNLTVLTGAQLARVLLRDRTATGVELLIGGERHRVRAGREVLLCAGAIGSPHALLLSGIGPAGELREHGLPVLVDSPEVGRNLADHLYAPVSVAARRDVSPGVGDGRAEAAEYLSTRRGRLTSNLAEALAFVRTEAGLAGPDVELLWLIVPHLSAAAAGHGLTLATVLLQPASRGTITLGSPDPLHPPVIDAGYLSDPADLRVLAAGVRLAQRILTQPALAAWVGEPLAGGALDPATGAIERLCRAHAQTLYHPVGTCRMGSDPGAVLDPELRVRGVRGLRVVDASALPRIPRGHTQAPAVMLAERAAGLISGAAAPGCPRPAAAARPAAG